MTSFAKKHNVKPSPFTFQTPENHPYKKPIELVTEFGLDKTYKVNAFYINKGGKFGDEPVIVTDDFILNAPSHLVGMVKEVLEDSESINLVLDGQVYFKFYEYENSKGSQVGVTWVDA